MPAASLVGIVFGALGALWLVFHGLAMQFVMSPSAENLKVAAAGRWVTAAGVVAGVAVVVGAIVSRRGRPSSRPAVGVALLLGALLLVPVVEVWAARQTSRAAELAELEAFNAPAGFVGGGGVRDHGESGVLERSWRVHSSVDAASACERLERSFRAWADEGSVAVDPTSRPCFLSGRRRGDRATAAVTPDGRDGFMVQVQLFSS